MELSNNYKLFIMYTTYHDIFGYVVEKILILLNGIINH